MAPDIYDRAHGLAVACLQHQQIASWVLADTKGDVVLGDAGALGKKVGEFEKGILDELRKSVESK